MTIFEFWQPIFTQLQSEISTLNSTFSDLVRIYSIEYGKSEVKQSVMLFFTCFETINISTFNLEIITLKCDFCNWTVLMFFQLFLYVVCLFSCYCGWQDFRFLVILERHEKTFALKTTFLPDNLLTLQKIANFNA